MRTEVPMKHSILKAASALTVGILGTVLITAAPAQAATGFTSNSVTTSMNLPNCTGYTQTATTGTGPTGSATLTPDVPFHASWSGTRTQTASSDTAVQNYAMTSSVIATTSGTTPRSISVSYNGKYALAAPSNATCTGQAQLRTVTSFAFTTTQPLLVTMSYRKTGLSYTEIYIENYADSAVYVGLYGQDGNGSMSGTTYLPPGTYSGDVVGALYGPTATSSYAATGSVTMNFSLPGSATSGPSGAATRYVSLAKGRICPAGSLRTSVTGNATVARQIGSVIYTVNGRVVKRISNPLRGRVVTLAAASTSSMNVGVKVTLKNGKKYTESASYRNCTM